MVFRQKCPAKGKTANNLGHIQITMHWNSIRSMVDSTVSSTIQLQMIRCSHRSSPYASNTKCHSTIKNLICAAAIKLQWTIEWYYLGIICVSIMSKFGCYWRNVVSHRDQPSLPIEVQIDFDKTLRFDWRGHRRKIQIENIDSLPSGSFELNHFLWLNRIASNRLQIFNFNGVNYLLSPCDSTNNLTICEL